MDSQRLMRMCKVIVDDATIAKHFGCSIETVKAVRGLLPVIERKAEAKILPAKIQNAETNESQYEWPTIKAHLNIREATTALLKRQIETGQHRLTNEQVLDVKAKYKW